MNQKSPSRVQIVGQRALLVVDGPADARIRAVTDAQCGRASRRQLLAAGLTDQMIRTRVARGQLTPTRRGIYAAGPLEMPLAAETEAILICGPGSRLSHLSAFRLWELGDDGDRAPAVTVADSSRGRSHADIEVHRSNSLRTEPLRMLRRLPVTSVERTLIDVGGLLTPRRHERGLDEALARRLTTIARLERTALATRANHPGTPHLRRLLVERRGPYTITHSEAEERLLALIRQAELPEPHLQARLYGYAVDAYWPSARFAVEIDGFAWHTTKTNFNRDRRKDRALADHGITVTRVSGAQVRDEPLPLVAHIARRLAAAA